ncbi:hypothetical protein L218DRAFT_938799 [Marasmius fiardii PR-910]|nr:hypothetical protein L218DRAFT_938799 [Marasmius fiardii PR-910]
MYIYNNPVSTVIPRNRIQEALESIQYSYRHNSQARFPQPKCAEGTHEAILKALLWWAHTSPSQEVPGVCWLWGSAGVDKSAIAQTVAERYEGNKLLASFFFSRTDPNQNIPKYLALAIADALITAYPLLQDSILSVVNTRPAILHMTLAAQFRALVVEPLLQWKRNTPDFLSILPTLEVLSLVIIDGLDECLKPLDQKDVLSLALLAMKEQLPIHFLICSHPEPQIPEAFHQEDLHQFTKHVSLNDQSRSKDFSIDHTVHSQPLVGEWLSLVLNSDIYQQKR